MRLITIILSLFLTTSLSYTFCKERILTADTTKHTVKLKTTQDIGKSIRAAMKRHKSYFDDCVFTNKYSVEQRLKRYPFSIVAKIVAVSYRYEGPKAGIVIDSTNTKNDDDEKKKKIDTVFDEGLHIKNGILNYSSIREIKVLNKVQTNKLTNIIYNTDYKIKDFNSYDEGECFDPRNALIFFDKNGKVFDYLEICFECLNAESKSDKITVGTLCTQKYEILRKYFISLGIKYGTIKKD